MANVSKYFSTKKLATPVETPIKKRTRSQTKKTQEPHPHISVEYEKPAPDNWQETYDIILKQRDRVVAPVDTMGCYALADADQPESVRRYQTLISLMLSSQTRDEV